MPAPPFFPIFARARSGLARRGLTTWRATGDDPHFVIRLRPRPRYVVIFVDGLDQPLDPTIYFDTGDGFAENESYPVQIARRVACVIALDRFPDVRRLRFDPSAYPMRFRLMAFGVRWLWLARRLVQWANVLSKRTATIVVVDGMEGGAVDSGDWGTKAQSSSLERHFAHVMALGARLPLPASAGNAAEPLVSLIVPVFDADPAHLDALLASVRAQGVPRELILSDDGSRREDTRRWLDARGAETDIVILRGQENRGIAGATNAGVAVARGAWVALLDHDDALAPHALKLFARALEARPDARFFYTDEVVTDDALRPMQYFVKPAFDPVLLSGVNYINHLSFYRRDRLAQIGGLDAGFQGSQDYDLVLRYLDGIPAREIVHIPYPAYLWRRHEAAHSLTSQVAAVANARRALVRSHQKNYAGVSAEPALVPDLHRLRFDTGRAEWPLVSVVIPNRDAFDLVSAVLNGLADDTDYPALEIVIVDNGTSDPRVLDLYERAKTRFSSFHVDIHEEAFNFSRAVNRGIGMATGSFVLLLNNDIEMVDSGWLKEMVSCFAYPGTGIVGARLLYPDRRIQHAGVIVGLGGAAGHWYSHAPETASGPMGRLAVRQSLSAVTGAAMLISRACLEATGPFDEERFAIAYNDVDFCLRAGERGFRVVWTPFATLIHHESASRGSDERVEAAERFQREKEMLRQRHGTETYEDRAFSPWYTRERAYPIYKFRSNLPDCR